MEQNRTQNVVRGIGAGIINNVLTVLLPFLTRTAIIYALGIQYAGLNTLFGSIINILNISELGIGSAISYSMYRPLQERDDDLVCALLSFYRKCYRVIGIITLSVGLGLFPFLDKLVAGEYPADMNLQILYLVYLINNVLGYFLFAYKKVLLSANQRYDVEVSIASVCTILQNLLQVGLLVLVHNYYVYVLVIPLITLIGNLVSSAVVDRLFPQFICRGRLDREHLQGIKKSVGGIICTKISETIFTSVDNIVISAFLGLAVLAVYGNYYYVISCLIGIFAVVHNSIRPVIGNCMITDSEERLYDHFQTYQFMYTWLAAWSAICLSCMYQTFEYVWVGADNLLPLSIVILLAVYFYVGRMGALQEIYLEAAGVYWERRYVPLTAAALNLTLNIILVQWIGLYGVILSTVVSHILVTVPCNIVMVKKYCFCDKMSLRNFGSRIFLEILVCVLSGGMTYCVCGMLGETSILHLIQRGFVCVILPNLIYFICFSRSGSMKKAASLLRGIIKKKVENGDSV